MTGLPTTRTWEDIQFALDQLNSRIKRGNGSPEGKLLGKPGDLYTNLQGGVGSTLFVKETGGHTTTGWAPK